LAGGRTAEELYERTQRRLFELERFYELHVVWGHELKQKMRKSGTFKRLWDTLDIPGQPLDPRKDALRGGRCEPFKLHHVCAEDEEIVYIDIVRNKILFSLVKFIRFPSIPT
jgi:hypothetical protein